MSGYTVIDLETTGFSPAHHDRVVELAVVYVSWDGRIEDRWSTLVNPQRDVGPTSVHGITASEVRAAPTFAEIAPYVLRAIGGRVLVAHNASFDLRFLAAELIRSGLSLEQLPITGLCTMQWSTHFLDAPSRKLVDCCAAAGITIDRAHAAASDAMATARLLAHFVRLSGRVVPWSRTAETCSSYLWPPYRGQYEDLRLLRRGSAPVTPPDHWLDRIFSRMPRALDPRVDAYLQVLEDALLDGILTDEELQSLVDVAAEAGLSRGQVVDVHTSYLRALAEVALADGVVTPAERADLHLIARLLDLPDGDVDLALDAVSNGQFTESGPTIGNSRIAPPSAVDQLASAGIRLNPGDRVCLTGEMALTRSAWEERLRSCGLEPVGSVSRKTRLLVTADPETASGKATKARGLGVPIVSEVVFERLLHASFTTAA